MGKIIANNIGKAYKRYSTRWARLAEWLLPGTKPRHELTWVLHGINFTVSPGEAVGIVGMNGAGKSTLLKMITGTTTPTTGSVEISGRVAALLELGMGFHPDFTGRQNVYMAGQLLGLNVHDINNVMHEIESFAEIGEYIDQPVRMYSSGMQMRLAFSVATVERPDVLIVDEALSVGDVYFQAKSFGRIKKFKEQGTTLLLVSHDQSAIANICSRALLLERGSLIADGKPSEIMNLYSAKQSKTSERHPIEQKGGSTISGNLKAKIEDFHIEDELGENLNSIKVGQKIRLVFDCRLKEVLSDATLGFQIKDRLGNIIYGTNTRAGGQRLPSYGRTTIIFELYANIGVGDYTVTAALHKGESHYQECYFWQDGLSQFSVVNPDNLIFVGSNYLASEVRVECLES